MSHLLSRLVTYIFARCRLSSQYCYPALPFCLAHIAEIHTCFLLRISFPYLLVARYTFSLLPLADIFLPIEALSSLSCRCSLPIYLCIGSRSSYSVVEPLPSPCIRLQSVSSITISSSIFTVVLVTNCSSLNSRLLPLSSGCFLGHRASPISLFLIPDSVRLLIPPVSLVLLTGILTVQVIGLGTSSDAVLIN